MRTLLLSRGVLFIESCSNRSPFDISHLKVVLQYNILYLSSEQVDENKSNTIEFDEFLALMASDTWADIEKNEIVKVRS